MWNSLELARHWMLTGKSPRSQKRRPSRNGRSRFRVTRRCGFEPLENRTLMSVSPLAAAASRALPTIEVADHGGIYNGSAFPATVTLMGRHGPAVSLEGVKPILSYCNKASGVCSAAAPTAAGTYTVTAAFPGGARLRSGQEHAGDLYHRHRHAGTQSHRCGRQITTVRRFRRLSR